jgi:hypothetical protein
MVVSLIEKLERRDISCSSIDLNGLRVLLALLRGGLELCCASLQQRLVPTLFLLGAGDTEVFVITVLHKLIDFRVMIHFTLTVDVIPLVALIAHKPVLAVSKV